MYPGSCLQGSHKTRTSPQIDFSPKPPDNEIIERASQSFQCDTEPQRTEFVKKTGRSKSKQTALNKEEKEQQFA